MIDLLIFSKDRACQLDALLNSIDKYLPKWFNIFILYKTSSDRYDIAYEELKLTYNKAVFIKENNFYKDSMQIISDSKTNHLCFSTDDMVIFKNPDTLVEEILPKYKNTTFSLRLGFNTSVQDCHKGLSQFPLNLYVDKKNFIEWNSNNYPAIFNYGYPLAVDMHIFDKNCMTDILNEIEFKNSNELESKLQNYRNYIYNISSYKHSIAVNIPCNNISNYTLANNIFSYSLESLNDAFLNGKRICIDSISKNKIVGCHQEIELILK